MLSASVKMGDHRTLFNNKMAENEAAKGLSSTHLSEQEHRAIVLRLQQLDNPGEKRCTKDEHLASGHGGRDIVHKISTSSAATCCPRERIREQNYHQIGAQLWPGCWPYRPWESPVILNRRAALSEQTAT